MAQILFCCDRCHFFGQFLLFVILGMSQDTCLALFWGFILVGREKHDSPVS